MMVRVSDEVMTRVAAALKELGNDTNMKRTKRSIEEISGLSHDAVARAFRQDRTEGSAWKINATFDSMTIGPEAKSPIERKAEELSEQLGDARRTITELRAQLEGYAQVIAAQQLQIHALSDVGSGVVPMRRRPPRR